MTLSVPSSSVNVRVLGLLERLLDEVADADPESQAQEPDHRGDEDRPPATARAGAGRWTAGVHVAVRRDRGPWPGLGEVGVDRQPGLGDGRALEGGPERRLEGGHERGHVRVALLAVGGQAAPEHGLDLGRERTLRGRHRRQRAGVSRVEQRQVLVRRAAGQQQVGQRGQGVLVGAGVRRLGAGLLGSDVRRRAGDHREPGRHVERPAQAEVTDHRPDLGLARGRAGDAAEQHVGRLHVAVHDVAVVQGLETGPDLAHDLHGLGDGQALDLEPVRERPLVGVRHDEVGPAVVELAGVVHGDDVGRLDLAEVAPLLLEPLPDVRVLGPVVREHLHRDGRVQLLVVGEPHGREGTVADPPPHHVAPEPLGIGRWGMDTR